MSSGWTKVLGAAETSWDINGPSDPAGLLDSYRDPEAARTALANWPPPAPPAPRLDATVHNTAFLGGAVAALAELTATDHPHGLVRTRRAAGLVGPEAATDLATAESAITLLREDRDRRGYTAEDAATAQGVADGVGRRPGLGPGHCP